ncbi:type II secretion system protein [bacterium]|nr:type II secretion system protein [bacterium]
MMNARKSSGFTLLEAMISILVVGLLFLGALMIFYQSVEIQLSSEDVAYANNLARTGVEEVKALRWLNIPLDDTGTSYLDPYTQTKPNTYVTDDGEYRVVRTITDPMPDVKRITVNIYTIDSSGEGGVSSEPAVTMVTDLFKHGM